MGAGLPLDLYDFGFLADSSAEMLVVQGDRDAFGPVDRLREAAVNWPPQARLEVIAGADHFFEQHLELLRQSVVSFFTRDEQTS